MDNKARANKISEVLLTVVALQVTLGLNYEDGEILFRAGSLVMGEIDKNPDVNDESLADQVHKFVEQELDRQPKRS